MRSIVVLVTVSCFIFLTNFSLYAETFVVNSQQSFEDALSSAAKGDTILWESGTYADIEMDIEKSNLTISAQVLGATIFSGSSKVKITGDYITFRGFQFLDGDIGKDDVLYTSGSHIQFSELNISGYRCYKYLWIEEECQYIDVSYCNFEKRLNNTDQNILSIFVDSDQPGYHKIRYCSFKNFTSDVDPEAEELYDGGVEAIRIGVSYQSEYESRSIVEYCYFTACDGDGEIISNKATQNTFRYNTFEDNPYGELVLRHGSKSMVYGNFFINNYGGIRIRQGQDHAVFNNYFMGLTERAMYLQKDEDDPLKNINIVHNTFINSEPLILDGIGTLPGDAPENVVIANNIFSDPKTTCFLDATGFETYIGNIATGSLGVSVNEGFNIVDPELSLNSSGFYQLAQGSPAIDSSVPGYPDIIPISGIDVDTSIALDIVKNDRASTSTSKDVGCSEYPQNEIVAPIATAGNTGPTYLMDTSTSILVASYVTPFDAAESSQELTVTSNTEWVVSKDKDWILVSTGSGMNTDSFDITVLENTSIASRTGIVTLTGGGMVLNIPVVQNGKSDVGSPEIIPVAIMASDDQEENSKENTQDKDLDTRWSAEGIGQTITYDLGALMEVSLIKIAMYKGDTRVTYFDIAVSTDGTNFTTVLESQSNSGETLALENYSIGSHSARYVRLIGNGNSEDDSDWNSITEVEIYGALNALSVISKELSQTKIFPIPTSDTLKLTNSNRKIERVTLLTVDGRVILEQKIQEHTYEMNLSTVRTGMYVLALESEGNSVYKTILVD